MMNKDLRDSTQERGAGQFESGGDSQFEILQMGANAGIAYWIGFQRATARVREKTEPITFRRNSKRDP